MVNPYLLPELFSKEVLLRTLVRGTLGVNGLIYHRVQQYKEISQAAFHLLQYTENT